MNKREINEIRKLYTKDNSIQTLSGCYVSAEGEILSTFSKTFLNIEETEFYKYLELLKKGLSGTIGKNIHTYPVNNADVQKSLLALRDSKLKNEDMLRAFYESIVSNYPVTENYAIIIINNAYDIIYRGKDGFKNADCSESVFDYLHVLICPVKLEKPGLVFDIKEGCFVQKDTRWEMQAPACSFLYPSFEDRSEDVNFVTCYTKDTDGAYTNLLTEILSIEISMSPEEQTEGFQTIMETVLQNCNEKIDIITSLQESVKEKVAEAAGQENIEFGEKEISDILNDIGISGENIAIFEEAYKKTFGIDTIPAGNLFKEKGVKIKTPDIVIKVKPDKNIDIQSKLIDGKKCLIIDIDQNEDIEVNGINL